MNLKNQGGMFLLEALIAILVFSLGILGMIAMGGAAIASQSDAQYRTDATTFANEIASKIALNVDSTSPPGSIQASLQAFAHQPIVASSAFPCDFSGAASTSPLVTGWINEVIGGVPGVPGLPGATNISESIAVDTSQPMYSTVTVTICWQPPSASALASPHRQVLVSYVPNQT
jgi:type IV pilus assembly protein PilV